MPLLEKLLSFITNPADRILDQGWTLDKQAIGSLWVGGLNALSLDFLQSNNIGVVISLCPVEEELPRHINHHKIQVRDHAEDRALMLQLIPGLMRIIHKERLQGRNVLVHCRAGMQRAPTVGTMYLNKYYYEDVHRAVSKVKKARPIAFSNGYTFRNVLGI